MIAAMLQRLHRAVRLANRRRLHRRNERKRLDYTAWAAKVDTIGARQRQMLQQRLAKLGSTPTISVLMPTYNPDRQWLDRAVASVRNQIYPHWELCIADDASTSPWLARHLASLQREDPRIRVVHRATNGHICAASNSAFELASGEWLALLDHDDELTEHALLLVAEAATAFPDAGLIYSDEDKLDELGHRTSPHFKPDWNHELCLAYNMVCHLAVFRTELVKRIGGFREGFEGSQDHDLVLRCAEHLQPKQIVHIPHVLYHWRVHEASTARHGDVKPYATEAGTRAVEQHLHRLGHAAKVSAVAPGRYRVHWPDPNPWPKVSIVVPTRNHASLLRVCLESVVGLTDYPDYEILVVDNGSDEADALELINQWGRQPNVKVIRDDGPFNYSAINNRAVAHAHGSVLVLMNNDIEVLAGDWLKEMVAQACRPTVGAVGAKLLYADRTVQHAGVILGIAPQSPFGGVAGHAHRGLPQDAGGYMDRANVAQALCAVTAACLAIRREVFEAVGGLDAENLAVAFNDVDLCLRVREMGYENIWTPHAMLVHHESASRGHDHAPKHAERFLRERAHMLQRWPGRLANDPAYNPNLSLIDANFHLDHELVIDWSVPWHAVRRTSPPINWPAEP